MSPCRSRVTLRSSAPSSTMRMSPSVPMTGTIGSTQWKCSPSRVEHLPRDEPATISSTTRGSLKRRPKCRPRRRTAAAPTPRGWRYWSSADCAVKPARATIARGVPATSLGQLDLAAAGKAAAGQARWRRPRAGRSVPTTPAAAAPAARASCVRCRPCAASPYSRRLRRDSSASMSKLTGSAPMLVMICASPE